MSFLFGDIIKINKITKYDSIYIFYYFIKFLVFEKDFYNNNTIDFLFQKIKNFYQISSTLIYFEFL